MKLQHVPLDQIVWNPWRDKDLYPIDEDHIKELRESINDHGFFASVKGRRVNGKVEIACGHARIAAARRARLDTVPIFIDEIDDDAMLRVMVEENASQAGSSAGAIMNEVAAVTRRLIDGLLDLAASGQAQISEAFESKTALDTARGRLQRRAIDGDGQNPIGHHTILRYLGHGDENKSHRSRQQIREAISALTQSGRYDKIIDEAIRKHPLPVEDTKSAKDTAVIRAKPTIPRKAILDERAAAPFKTETQFTAFREAVTTSGAQKAIPVNQQSALAKEIMRTAVYAPKQVPTTYIKGKVQERVQAYMKEQRKLDKAERDAYLAEQIELAIDDELFHANRLLRGLISSLLKLEKLAEKYPKHPKLGGFSARLDDLVGSIKQFSRKLK